MRTCETCGGETGEYCHDCLQRETDEIGESIAGMKEGFAQRASDLEKEIKRLKERARNSDDQFVWLAEWCRNNLGIDNNQVIGSASWPSRLVEVVAHGCDMEMLRLKEAVRVRGGCRLLSQGDKCDCGLCKRDNEIKRLKEETILLALIAAERDELRAVVQEIDSGDNPDLWGTLVAQRDTVTGILRRAKEHLADHGDWLKEAADDWYETMREILDESGETL